MDLLLIIGIALLLVMVYLVLRRPKSKSEKEKWFSSETVAKKERSKAPITGRCYFCDEKVSMPYKCKYCNNLFCDDHRLPENHDCHGIKSLRREKQLN